MPTRESSSWWRRSLSSSDDRLPTTSKSLSPSRTTPTRPSSRQRSATASTHRRWRPSSGRSNRSRGARNTWWGHTSGCRAWSLSSWKASRRFKSNSKFPILQPVESRYDFLTAAIWRIFFPYNIFTNCFQVRYLKIIEKSGYQALPWVRYITQNGDYQLRTQN